MALEGLEAVWLLPVGLRARRARGATLTLHPQTCSMACVVSFMGLYCEKEVASAHKKDKEREREERAHTRGER